MVCSNGCRLLRVRDNKVAQWLRSVLERDLSADQMLGWIGLCSGFGLSLDRW